MTPVQKAAKRMIDLIVAASGMFFLLPLMIFVAIKIKLDSAGPIFFLQERLGYQGNPFTIIKFRSMYPDSEKEGPALSFQTDKRVTKWGLKIRKWKMDELPQLYNILRGEMSLVGPRPERKHFIDKMAVNHSPFDRLHQVKPGLTSLGMISCGYASNIEQLIHRTTYDVRYIERYSLSLDFYIIFSTLRMLVMPVVFPYHLNLK